MPPCVLSLVAVGVYSLHTLAPCWYRQYDGRGARAAQCSPHTPAPCWYRQYDTPSTPHSTDQPLQWLEGPKQKAAKPHLTAAHTQPAGMPHHRQATGGATATGSLGWLSAADKAGGPTSPQDGTKALVAPSYSGLPDPDPPVAHSTCDGRAQVCNKAHQPTTHRLLCAST